MGPVLMIEVEATGERRRHQAGRLTIGRAAGNDLMLPDPSPQPSLSRKHCAIDATGEGFAVLDLASTNGTRLNSRPVPPHTPTPLADGDRLEIGLYALRLTLEEQRSPIFQAGATLLPSHPASPVPPYAAAATPPGGSLELLLGGLAAPAPEPFAGPATPPLSPSEDPLGRFFEELPQPVSKRQPPPRHEGATAGNHAQPQLEAFRMEVARPPSPPPPPPAPPAEQEAALLRTFLEGAGLEPKDVPGEPAELMREAGRVLAAMAVGLRDLLAARALVKDHAGVARTMIGAVDNNPLKYAVGRTEAVRSLLVRRDVGYLPPLAAIEARIDDLKAHELALLEGVQAAVQELLAHFDPAQLEARLADSSTLGLLLQGGRRARLWELYTERYAEIAEVARVRFMGDVDRAFARAYERKVLETRASRQPRGDP
jgi:type VI secretion system FHA domain protein